MSRNAPLTRGLSTTPFALDLIEPGAGGGVGGRNSQNNGHVKIQAGVIRETQKNMERHTEANPGVRNRSDHKETSQSPLGAAVGREI